MSGDLTAWLAQIGLGGHAGAFLAQGIDWDVVGDLSEQDLKELGLPLGDRKRLLRALAALGEATAPSRERGAAAQETSPLSTASCIEAERRHVTVMFVDLVGSTELTQGFDPEDMRRVLGIYHAVCASAIEAHEGHIAQYLGDGLLVYFGYPKAHEDDAMRAVLAGLAIIAAIARVGDNDMEGAQGVRLHVRIGIETGLVVAGEVGAGSSLDHQAIVGETPIVAARLQAIAPSDALVVGPAAHRLIEGAFVLEELGLRELKGTPAPVLVHRVLAQAKAIDRFEIRTGQVVTPLVGRVPELEMIRQRWKQSADGEMRCVLLTGEPGIGKSRVLRAFRDSIEGEVHDVIQLHCSAYYRNSPFWPVLQWLQNACGLDLKADDAGNLERLDACVGAMNVPFDETMMVLASLFGIRTGDRFPPLDTSSPAFKRRSLDVLIAVIAHSAQARPLLVAVEDVHWIDPSTVDFIRSSLERLVSTKLLLLLTARPEFKPGWTYPQFVQINLDRLSRSDCFALVERMTHGKRLPRLVLDEIVAKTDGVPLFVEELTKAVIQSDLLRDAGDRYELAAATRRIAIPDTLQGSLLARLDRLEPAVREAAQIASTIGREFGRRLLSLISAIPESELQCTLDRLTEAEIILPAPGASVDGGAYLFRHALIQEIAYQSLLMTRRRHFHAMIAAALEAHYPEVVEQHPELIAQNLAAASLPERAIVYWQRAGERALARAACDEAIAHAGRGLQLIGSLAADAHVRAAQSLPLLLIRGEAEQRLGRREAMQTFREAAQSARDENLPAYLVQAALGFDRAETFLEGSGKASIPLLEEALALLGTEETVERCRLLSRLVRTLHMTGGAARGFEFAFEAVALARRLNDRPSLFDALACEVMHVGAQPLPAYKFAERQAVLQELSQIAEELGDDHSIGHACARCLAGYLEIGDFARFDRALERYRQIATSGQHFVDRWCMPGAQAMRAILVGDFVKAESKAKESLELAEGIGARFAAGVFGMQMFAIRREQGRLAEIAPLLKRFSDDHPDDSVWGPGLMLIWSELGYEAQARASLERMLHTESAIPVDSKRLITLTYFAEVAARLGEREYATRIYTLLLPFRDQAVTVPAFTLCCGAAARYLGMLAGALRDWTAAEEHFDSALQMDERLQAWPWLAHTQREYAVMLAARARVEDRLRAAQLLTASAATAKTLGMYALLERISGASDNPGPKN
ncbi:adenylate/guanylate cyclase domain-containing protein [Caballeronia ptereochthonis]|uniref:Adenylate/guanylate cyclase n=1 Tax=Caballeronia ptereochthonis TaxID=1777144 RepID=A0A158C841_9BURK|nr:adenylate/guanylate cyclase domain-containing protein [Caballeronia ptereochthonis]SAK77687.1 adenylate/guanylate cyclase [Caballeronia ptereochthonis]